MSEAPYRPDERLAAAMAKPYTITLPRTYALPDETARDLACAIAIGLGRRPLFVPAGSYLDQYCRENGIPVVLTKPIPLDESPLTPEKKQALIRKLNAERD